MWVLVFPETVTEVSTAGETGQIPHKVRGGRKTGVCRWSGVYAGAWACEGTAVCDRQVFLSCLNSVSVFDRFIYGCLLQGDFRARTWFGVILCMCECWFYSLNRTGLCALLTGLPCPPPLAGSPCRILGRTRIGSWRRRLCVSVEQARLLSCSLPMQRPLVLLLVRTAIFGSRLCRRAF